MPYIVLCSQDNRKKEGKILQLIVNNITKSFGEKEVLRGISLNAHSGKALGVLGRNGAGKTTTIRIIMGVFPADSGEILVDDKPINRNELTIGYLPEERGMYPKKKIIDQLVYFGRLHGLSKNNAISSSKQWLERLYMTEYANNKLETLSKGNQQKIQLAAAVMCKPSVVILDEPFSGLDPVNAMLLKDIIKELINEDTIVFFSSHQMNYIEEFCEDIAILNGGTIVLNGAINDIKRSYRRDMIAIDSLDYKNILKLIFEKFSNEIISAEADNETDNRVKVKLKEPSSKQSLYNLISSSGIDIDGMGIIQPTLNDIFVEYTEDKI